MGLTRGGGILLAGLVVALALTSGRFSHAAAQEATPAATPAVACAPAVGDGDMGGMDMGATPAASPVAADAPIGSPADAETAARVVVATENAAACYNGGDVEAFLGLVTDHFVHAVLGSADKDEAAAGMSGEDGIEQVADLAIDADSVQTYDDGRFSVDVTYVQFAHQFVAARWFFVERGSDLLLDDELLLSPEPDVDFVTIISATVAADDGATVGFDQSSSVPATDAIIVHLVNNSTTDREFAVVMLPASATLNEDGTLPEDMASLDALMTLEGVAPVGYVPVAAGGIVDMALIGLPPGVYVLVDFSDGTVAPLTVAEPAA